MARANRHPSSWVHGGYNEIQDPPLRYSLINRERLIACCGLENDEQLRKGHRQWVEEVIHNGEGERDPEWTESIAVGVKRSSTESGKNFNLGYWVES